MGEILIEGRNLSMEFPAGHKKRIHAVSDVSLRIAEGETLAVVGESGCGKSTLGRLLTRLLTPTAGELLVRGTPVTHMREREFKMYRRQLQMVFQDPFASLDPRMRVRNLIAEPLEAFHICKTKQETTQRVLALMEEVGVPGEFLYRYPHQFSGGQRQRIGIARAIAVDPDLIVCDEPVSALDVSVQNQILNLLHRLQKARGMASLFISHDLSVVRHISDRVAVMFLGKLCEVGETERVFQAPLHPYTRLLLQASPVPDPGCRAKAIQLLSGEVPSPVDPPSGCRFHTRCPCATGKCAVSEPVLRWIGGRETACHHVEEQIRITKTEEGEPVRD